MWSLAPKMPKMPEDAQQNCLGTFPKVGHLRETPLSELAAQHGTAIAGADLHRVHVMDAVMVATCYFADLLGPAGGRSSNSAAACRRRSIARSLARSLAWRMSAIITRSSAMRQPVDAWCFLRAPHIGQQCSAIS